MFRILLFVLTLMSALVSGTEARAQYYNILGQPIQPGEDPRYRPSGYGQQNVIVTRVSPGSDSTYPQVAEETEVVQYTGPQYIYKGRPVTWVTRGKITKRVLQWHTGGKPVSGEEYAAEVRKNGALQRANDAMEEANESLKRANARLEGEVAYYTRPLPTVMYAGQPAEVTERGSIVFGGPTQNTLAALASYSLRNPELLAMAPGMDVTHLVSTNGASQMVDLSKVPTKVNHRGRPAHLVGKAMVGGKERDVYIVGGSKLSPEEEKAFARLP